MDNLTVSAACYKERESEIKSVLDKYAKYQERKSRILYPSNLRQDVSEKLLPGAAEAQDFQKPNPLLKQSANWTLASVNHLKSNQRNWSFPLHHNKGRDQGCVRWQETINTNMQEKLQHLQKSPVSPQRLSKLLICARSTSSSSFSGRSSR